MGFFKKLFKPKSAKSIAKQAVKIALKPSKPKKPKVPPPPTKDELSFTVNFTDWLNGKSLIGTGLHRKHPEVRAKSYKALIEKTIENHGAFSMSYGQDFIDHGEFFPLSIDDESVSCRELPDSYCGESNNAPKRKFKFKKIELEEFVTIVDKKTLTENKRIISESLVKKGELALTSYIDEKGIEHFYDWKEIIPIRIDDEFLYYKDTPRSKKEKQIRLCWLQDIEFCEDEDDDE